MNDMSAVIVAKSDQINADDLIAGPRVVTIAAVKINPGTEQPVQMALEGTDKLFRPCKTVSRVIVGLWGPDATQYIGKSLRLFRDPNVTWAGVKVGGIRIDQASHIDSERTLVVKESQKASKLHKIKPLKIEPVADKVADGVRALINRLSETGSDYNAIIAEPAVVKQRAWLAKNRPELAEQVEAAIPADDPFEGPDDSQRGEPDDVTEIVAMYEAGRTADGDMAAIKMGFQDHPSIVAARAAASEVSA